MCHKIDSEWRFRNYAFQYALLKNTIKFLDFVQGHRKNNQDINISRTTSAIGIPYRCCDVW